MWRPAVLALLRAAEALKPVLARVRLGRFGMPGALRAGEGPNGWGAVEYREKSASLQVNSELARALRRAYFHRSCTEQLARVGAELLGMSARCAPR